MTTALTVNSGDRFAGTQGLKGGLIHARIGVV
jgi:hypothetical protein